MIDFEDSHFLYRSQSIRERVEARAQHDDLLNSIPYRVRDSLFRETMSCGDEQSHTPVRSALLRLVHPRLRALAENSHGESITKDSAVFRALVDCAMRRRRERSSTWNTCFQAITSSRVHELRHFDEHSYADTRHKLPKSPA
jgi:hypothetical protein